MTSPLDSAPLPGDPLAPAPSRMYHESVAQALLSAHVAPTSLRVAALLVDWLLVAVPAGVVFLVAYVVTGPHPWRVPLALLFALVVEVMLDLVHVAVAEGSLLHSSSGASCATLGKRFCGLEVLVGRTGNALVAPLAALRRLLLDVLVLLAPLAFLPFGVWRNTGVLGFAPGGPTPADWLVAAAVWLALLVPFACYRATSFGGQWPHDRFAQAVVVQPERLEAQMAVAGPRPLRPEPPPVSLFSAPRPVVVSLRYRPDSSAAAVPTGDSAAAATARHAVRPAAAAHVVPAPSPGRPRVGTLPGAPPVNAPPVTAPPVNAPAVPPGDDGGASEPEEEDAED